ncbi:hypothetical protein [Mesorhizobium sp. M0847]|uniref:hypothetical protein n=1 Tax=unclassified Mesorhizobium TaxID=325217 RepID=UPI00333BAE12
MMTCELSELYAVAREGCADRLTPLPVLKLDRSRAARQDYSGSCVEFLLRQPRTAQPKLLSCRHGTTLFTMVQAGVVPAPLSGQGELVIGTVSANRTLYEFEGLICLFVNTLLLRIALSGDSILGTLERVNAAVFSVDLTKTCHLGGRIHQPARHPGSYPGLAVYACLAKTLGR